MLERKKIVPKLAKAVHRTFKASIDTGLYSEAKNEGIVFIFSTNEDRLEMRGFVNVDIHAPGKFEFEREDLEDIFDRKGRFSDISKEEKLSYMIAAEIGLSSSPFNYEDGSIGYDITLKNDRYSSKRDVIIIDDDCFVRKAVIVMLHSEFIKTLDVGKMR